MDFDSLARKRRSIRSFKPGGVSIKSIKEIINAGRWAPSAGNEQPWLFIVASSESDRLALRDICEKSDLTLEKRITPGLEMKDPFSFFSTCPFLILVFGNKEKLLWQGACWSAITLMCLKAVELGLGTFIYSPPRKSEIARLMDAPANWRLVAMLPVGEADEFPSPEDRPRKPLEKVLKRAEELPRMDRNTKTEIRKEETRARQFIAKSPVFSDLRDQVREELAMLVKINQIKKGGDVVKKGDPPGNFYIIAEGMVEILSDDGSGNEKVITFLGQGECFGEMSIITGEPVSATVRASSDLTAVALSMEDFLDLTENNPQLNFFFTQLITRRLRKTNLELVKETLMQGFTGRLTTISLPELVQAINISGKNGVLKLKGPDGGEAQVFFLGGNVVDTEMGEESGDEVFFKIMAWPDGEFNFLQEEVDRPKNMKFDTMGLLMEGMRRQDEETREPEGLSALDEPEE